MRNVRLILRQRSGNAVCSVTLPEEQAIELYKAWIAAQLVCSDWDGQHLEVRSAS
jgi:hypothetical protein